MPKQPSLTAELDFLRRHAPFKQMAENHQEFLAKRLKLAFFSKDEVITEPGMGLASRFYIIKQGRVRGEIDAGNGVENSAWELVTGESFPIGALLAKRPVNTVHRAVDDSFIYELEREDFQQLLNQSPVFHDFCTRRLASLLDTAMREIRAASADDVTGDNSLDIQLRRLLPQHQLSCRAETPIRTALEQMEQAQRRSIAILDAQQWPIGILTLRDVMTRITLPRVDIDTPIGEVMAPVTHTLGPEDFAFQAALQMAQSGIGHVCVVEDHKFLGIISERDLFSLQRVGLGNLSRAIRTAKDVASLKPLAADLRRLVRQMLAQGASVEQLSRIIATLNEHITQRIIVLAQMELGRPTCAFTWLAFGSEGRLEQTLKTEQANGILFLPAPGQSDEEARTALLPLATFISRALAELGYPLATDAPLANQPEHCLSFDEWKAQFSRWLAADTAEPLLKAGRYFDFRAIYGPDEALEGLRRWLLEQASANVQFRRLLAQNALRNRPPLGLFGDFKLPGHSGRLKDIDLQHQGILPFVDAARLIALQHRLAATNTRERLQSAARIGALGADEAAAWSNAYGYIQLLRMRRHLRQAELGEAMDDALSPEALNSLDRRILKESFRQARKLQTQLSVDYQL